MYVELDIPTIRRGISSNPIFGKLFVSVEVAYHEMMHSFRVLNLFRGDYNEERRDCLTLSFIYTFKICTSTSVLSFEPLLESVEPL